MKNWALPILFLCLAGCGSDAFIASKVKFKVLFAQKIIQVKFELNPEYQVQVSKSFSYDRLATTFLKWTAETSLMEIGTNLNGDPTVLKMNWPISPMKTFPIGKPWPASVPSGVVSGWSQKGEEISSQLLFQDLPDLIAGGAFFSEKFNKLPKKFLATQRFFNPNGDVEASVSVMGPVGNQMGGIYFFGNFGVNPFVASRAPELSFRTEEIMADEQGDWSWEIQATEPAKIISSSLLNLFPVKMERVASDYREQEFLFRGDTSSPREVFAP